MDITIPYYEDKTRISNSNIGWFLNKGPSFLHKMLTEDIQEEKNSTLERGTMIHEYLLQPEEFQKDYVIWDKSRPSSAQQEKFCQVLVNSIEIEPNKAVLNAYKEAYSIINKTDDKMLSEGLKIASTLKDYIDFIKQKDNRKMITLYDINMLEKIRNNIKSHKLANILLKHEGDYDDIKIYHEFHINWNWIADHDSESSIYIACKSLLDSIQFDFKNKICTIVDLKTTSKLWNFEESIDTYDYLRQLEYYKMAASWYIQNELKEDIKNWSFKRYIIAISTSDYQIRVFNLTNIEYNTSYFKIYDALLDIYWHMSNNLWEHTKEYYEGDGSEKLKL